MRSATCTYRVIMHSRVSYLLFACLLWGGLTCSLGQRNVGTEKMATNSEGTDRPTQELHLLGLFPFHGAFTGGEGYLPSVMMGIEDVNKLSDILPGYRLNLIWNDTMVRTCSMSSFIIISINMSMKVYYLETQTVYPNPWI